MDEFDLVMKQSQHGPEANSTTLEKPKRFVLYRGESGKKTDGLRDYCVMKIDEQWSEGFCCFSTHGQVILRLK